MNLIELADQNIEKFGEIPKLVFDEKEYTNLELIKKSNQLTLGFRILLTDILAAILQEIM